MVNKPILLDTEAAANELRLLAKLHSKIGQELINSNLLELIGPFRYKGE